MYTCNKRGFNNLFAVSSFYISTAPCSPMLSAEMCRGEVNISDCILRNEGVELICSVKNRSANVRWFHTNTSRSNWKEFRSVNELERGTNVLITSQGYWWCTVTESCPSFIPVVHVYPCMCNSSQLLCPTRKCVKGRNRCQNSRRERLCLTTTEILLPLPETVGVVHETNNIPTSTRTSRIPYQTSFEQTIDATTQMWLQPSHPPSVPPAADQMDRELSSSVVLYILGGVLVIVVLIIIVLSLGIGCHKRKYFYRFGSKFSIILHTNCRTKRVFFCSVIHA